jgi:endonuclease YncB( thermonuclease family)
MYMSSILQDLTYKDVPLFSFDGLMTEAKVVRVVDGDTVHIIFEYKGSILRLLARLAGIDTPEMHVTPDIAKRAKNRLAQLCTNCNIDLDHVYDNKQFNSIVDRNTKILSIECLGTDKYGRELVRLKDGHIDINDTMVKEDFAHPYDGGKKQAWSNV